MSATDNSLIPPPATTANPFIYRAFIDGLRAIAVLAVLFYHADIGCKGGYVGVDVFFVISGYLITGLILKDIGAGQFRIAKFWERRVLRIFPALAVVVIACLVVGWFLLLPIEFNNMGKSVVAQVLLISNIFFWRSSGYFTNGAESQLLLHTWSLAVEEQFYLFFPCLIALINRFSRNYLIPIILALCGMSFLLSINWSYTHADANFYLLPTRAWELGIGALLAIIPARLSLKRWLAEMLSWGGLTMVLCAVFLFDSGTRFPGVAAILPCVGTFAVIWANINSPTSVGRLLAMRPMVFVGLISYSLYLWHWPILVFSKYWSFSTIPAGSRILLLIVSMALAVISWKYVETPFRKRNVFKSRPAIFAFAGITTVVILLAGLFIYRSHGVPSRIPAAALQYANGGSDRDFVSNVSLKDARSGKFVEFGKIDKDLPIDVMVWGDSHAIAVMPVIDYLAKEYSIRGAAATYVSTCPAVGFESIGKWSLKRDSVAFNDAVVSFIRDKKVSNVVMVGFWGSYMDHGDSTRIRRGLIDTIDALKGTGTRIWIVRQVPQQQYHNVPVALALATIYHRGDPETFGIPLAEQRKAYNTQNCIFEGLDRYPRVTVLDPTGSFVDSDSICRVAKNGKALYIDNQHLTVAGAMELRPLFTPLFEGVKGRQSPMLADRRSPL